METKPQTGEQEKPGFPIMRAVKIVAWIAGLYISAYFHLHTLYLIVSSIIFIFSNLGKRKAGEMSAYSVFNKNFKRAAGSMDAQEMMFGQSKSKRASDRIFGEEQQKQAQKVDEYHRNQSKYGNKPCYCNSGMKFKKCCLVAKRVESQTKPKLV